MTDLSLPVGAHDHVRGPSGAPVTVVEYGDVECPSCRSLEPVLRRLAERRPDTRFVYRHFPLVSVHPGAYSGALALEAAAELGRFWELHGLLLAEGAALGRQALAAYAGQLGLDPQRLLRPASEAFDARVREDFDSGVASGVEGTPGLFVNGARYRGRLALEPLVAAVDEARSA